MLQQLAALFLGMSAAWQDLCLSNVYFQYCYRSNLYQQAIKHLPIKVKQDQFSP